MSIQYKTINFIFKTNGREIIAECAINFKIEKKKNEKKIRNLVPGICHRS